jgi:hypothetical protein
LKALSKLVFQQLGNACLVNRKLSIGRSIGINAIYSISSCNNDAECCGTARGPHAAAVALEMPARL